MKRLACLALLALAGCAPQTLGGDRSGIAVQSGGVGTSPGATASAHCGRYDRAASLQRTEVVAAAGAFRTVYYFDCR